MSRIVYVNGSYLPEEQAKISVFDRAFLFGDGVYEVTAVVDRKLLDFDAHLARLDRSLAEIALAAPLSHDALRALHRELIARNEVHEGIVYIEITRGVADRDFAYPENTAPTVVAFTQSRSLIANPYAETGVKIITIPDHPLETARHQVRAMLGQTMGKQQAKLKGAYEAWMVENGQVTEGTSSTAFILDARRRDPYPTAWAPYSSRRDTPRGAQVRRDARRPSLEERPFSVAEAFAAREAFMIGGVGLRAADGGDRRHRDRRWASRSDRPRLPCALYR